MDHMTDVGEGPLGGGEGGGGGGEEKDSGGKEKLWRVEIRGGGGN